MAVHPIPAPVARLPARGARSFALLSGLEAGVRAALVSVLPLEMYRAFGDAGTVSGIYFAVGCLSLLGGLLVPWLASRLSRRWTYTAGAILFMTGHAAGLAGGSMMAVAVLCNALGTVTVFICLNAYVMDYIARTDLGRTETLRMFYGGAAWTMGPILGVLALEWWRPLPFLIAAGLACILLAVFWYLRLGNGKLIARARAPAPNPLAYLARFAAQPRLVVGWTFAVMRSSAWWVFVVYLPIFAVEAGLDARIGGASLSAASLLLFTTPVMLRWMQARSVRRAVRTGFAGAAACFALATLVAPVPAFAVAALLAATLFLVLLDISGGLPFLMAVKPSERVEMAAVYSSFRDVSGIVTPGLAWLVLLVAPLPWLFAAMGAVLAGCWALAGTLNPRLGARRVPQA
ncbi:MAG: MFS transporter [Gemmobacter sp.]